MSKNRKEELRDMMMGVSVLVNDMIGQQNKHLNHMVIGCKAECCLQSHPRGTPKRERETEIKKDKKALFVRRQSKNFKHHCWQQQTQQTPHITPPSSCMPHHLIHT